MPRALSENHGSVQGLDFIPASIREVFVCAHDIAPLDHVRMQGVVQQAFDAEGYAANSLSKTINLPNSATVQEIEDAYSEAYRTGCKGITVYRDGSRQFQVLSTSKKNDQTSGELSSPVPAEVTNSTKPTWPQIERRATPAPGTKDPAPTYLRPARLQGVTDMVKLTDPTSGQRRSFLVTVNHLQDKPVEVMVISGRAGDEANADSEALGRVVSIALQYGVPGTAIIKTLRGLNGGLYGSYNGRLVGSKADLIAVALDTWNTPRAPEPVITPANPHPEHPPMDAHYGRCPACEERGLIREEGCTKCVKCGYGKC